MYDFTFTGIHHTALVTGDMETTVRYWRDLLGMRLVLTLGEEGQRLYFFEVSENNYLSFFEWPGVERMTYKVPGVPVTGEFSFDHISLGLASEDDLWNLAERLIAGGFFVSNVMDHGFLKAFYTYDPNGIPIEFCVDDPAIDPRAEPRILDDDPSPTALEGPEPDHSRWPTPEKERNKDERIVIPGKGKKRFMK